MMSGRKMLCMTLVVLLIVSMFPATIPTASMELFDMPNNMWIDEDTSNVAYDAGNGTQASPFEISTSEQLAKFMKDVNTTAGGISGKHFMLTNNIDLGGKRWTPIGNTEANTFRNGRFIGNGHVIKNLYVDETATGSAAAGLFGFLGVETGSSSTFIDTYINTLGIENGVIRGKYNVGGIAGASTANGNRVHIEDCFNNADIYGELDTNAWRGIGGIIGRFNNGSLVARCYNTGTITRTGIGNTHNDSGVGGISGLSHTVSNCFNMGDIVLDTASTTANVGAIYGRQRAGSAGVNNYRWGGVRINGVIPAQSSANPPNDTAANYHGGIKTAEELWTQGTYSALLSSTAACWEWDSNLKFPKLKNGAEQSYPFRFYTSASPNSLSQALSEQNVNVTLNLHANISSGSQYAVYEDGGARTYAPIPSNDVIALENKAGTYYISVKYMVGAEEKEDTYGPYTFYEITWGQTKVDMVKATANFTPESANVAGNVIDGNFATRWAATASGGVNPFVVLEFSDTTIIDTLGIAFYQGNMRRSYFSVSVSTNGVNYTEVMPKTTTGGNATGFEYYGFSEIIAKYVMITGYGNSSGGANWTSITEIEIHRPGSGLPVIVPGAPPIPIYSAPYSDDSYGIYTKADIAATKSRLESGDPKTVAAFNQFMDRVDNWCMNVTRKAPGTFGVIGYYTNANAHIESSKDLTHNAYAAYATALAWQITGEDKYAEKSVDILNDWATNNVSFSTSSSYADTPLVAAYGGVGLIYGAELITEYSGWTHSEQESFKRWVRGVYEPSIASITRINNWGSWAVLARISTYHYLGDVYNGDAMVNMLQGLIDYQINAVGEIPLEIERGTNGMWYTYFSLAPLTQTAQIAYNITGENYFAYTSSAGVSFKKTLDHFLPYVIDPSKWDDKYKSKYYQGETLSRPNIVSGESATANWPTNLYVAMGGVYDAQGTGYKDLVSGTVPVMGGWNNREAHHIAWCFPSLIESTDLTNEPFYPAPPSVENLPVCIEDDFETDTLDINTWRIQRHYINHNQISGVAAAANRFAPGDDANRSLKLHDTYAGQLDASKNIKIGFVEVGTMIRPHEGLSEVSFDIMFTGTMAGSNGSGIHIEDAYNDDAPLVSLMLNGSGNLYINGPSTPTGTPVDQTLVSGVSLNKWIGVKIFVNASTKTYDIYIDNILRASGQHYRNSSAESMSRIRFATGAAGNNATNFVDNVYAGGVRYKIENAILSGNTVAGTCVNGTKTTAVLFAAAYADNNMLLSVCPLERMSDNEAVITPFTGTLDGDISGVSSVRILTFEEGTLKPLSKAYTVPIQ